MMQPSLQMILWPTAASPLTSLSTSQKTTLISGYKFYILTPCALLSDILSLINFFTLKIFSINLGEFGTPRQDPPCCWSWTRCVFLFLVLLWLLFSFFFLFAFKMLVVPVETKSLASLRNAKDWTDVAEPCDVAFIKSTDTSSWLHFCVSRRSAPTAENSFGKC